MKPLPKLRPVPIILTTYNRLHFLKKTVEEIRKRTRWPYYLFVVSNHCTDGTKEYLKHAKVVGDIFDYLYLDENLGQSKSLNEGFFYMESWQERRPMSDEFVVTNEDIIPPDLKPCWLERLLHTFHKFEPDGYGALAMRIQRTSRVDIDEERDIIDGHKSCPSVYTIARRNDVRRLGGEPYGFLRHWNSHVRADKYKMILKKKFGFCTHLYADHIGFAVHNKGFNVKNIEEVLTYSGPEKMKLYQEKPYPDIDPRTNIPININHGVDKPEHEKRLKYWGQYTDYNIRDIKQEDLQNPNKVFRQVRKIEHAELRKYIKGNIILDLGCANKKITEDATGVDVYPFSNVDVVARADDLWWLKDGEVDTVLSSHLLEHFVDTKKVLAEWSRVLKSGGILAFVVPNGEYSKTILDPAHKVALTISILRRIVTQILHHKLIKLKAIKTNKPSIICVSEKK